MNKYRPELRFELTWRVPGSSDYEITYLTGPELDSFDFKSYDHVTASPLGWYAYRSAEGEWIRRPIAGSGLGKRTMDIIQALQLCSGVMLSPSDLASMTGNENLLDGGSLAARLRVIRQAHEESGENPRMYLSQRNGGYALCWGAEFSWLWVTRVRDS